MMTIAVIPPITSSIIEFNLNYNRWMLGKPPIQGSTFYGQSNRNDV
jgi:hypothetical protein